jgi:hypothetical protein
VRQTISAIVTTFPAEQQQPGGPFAFPATQPVPSQETATSEPKNEQPMLLPFATEARSGGLSVSQLRENFQA